MYRFLVKIFLISTVLLSTALGVNAQENVVTGLRSDMKRADALYADFFYKKALDLYLKLNEEKTDDLLKVKIASCYLNLNNTKDAIHWYAAALENGTLLNSKDIINYAMALTGEGRYKVAQKWYEKYLEIHENDARATNMLNASKEIRRFFIDSLSYLVHPVSINTEGSEFSPAFYKNGLVFVSSRKKTIGVKNRNQLSDQSYLDLYYSDFAEEANSSRRKTLKEPVKFNLIKKAKLHEGPITISKDGNTLFLTRNISTNKKNGGDGVKHLGIFISQKVGGKWVEPVAFPFNSLEHSVGHPSISNDGKTLYFISDMAGGFGGTDLYRSKWINGQWSKPENLGKEVNTSGDEMFPFIFKNFELYFASDGHGGIGGLDIFKVRIIEKRADQLVNLGYPVNSNKDDFGFILEENGVNGYFSSNRKSGGFDDDIYSVYIKNEKLGNIKLFTVSGRAILHNTPYDQSSPSVIDSVKVIVLDEQTREPVGEGVTNEKGMFKVTIPYSGDFIMIASKKGIGTHNSEFNIPDNKPFVGNFQLVFFRDKAEDFKDIQEVSYLRYRAATKQ
ncbi:hypothetical protein R9C00_01985 [Flammeovirgaceae bacterium SG7u.111]|nr:hypothetical protein [Flammeovirgaceae bacterium SG7u.132]WPO36212.1 hypothetical protein R9C00_01985 [Flammeovirgaceae bacterium SG7u.111]